MTPECWQQVTETFHAALARDADARGAFLADACAADPDLRAQVDALLEGHREAGAFGERPIFAPSDVPSVEQGGEDVASEPRRHPFVWVVWLCSALTLALFCYGAFLLVRDGRTSPSFGWTEVQRPDGGWYVEDVNASGPAAGRLQAGDRLVGLNGVPPIGPAGTWFHRRELSRGDSYVLWIARHGEPRNVTLTVTTATDSIAPRLAYFFVSLVWCAVGLFIGFARPDQAVGRLACLSAVATGHVFLNVGLIHLGLLVAPLHGVLGYHFFCRFPSGGIPRGVWRAALGVLYLTGGARAAFGLLVAAALLVGGVGEAAPYARVMQRFDLVGLLAFTGAVIGMLAVIPHK